MPEINPAHPDWGLHYKPREVVKLAYEAGWIDAKRLAVAAGVCIYESNGYEKRKYENLDDEGNIISTDRGLWMINDKAFPNITDAMAYDAVKATRAARQIYVGRNNMFTAWSSFNNQKYKSPKALGYAVDGVRNFLASEFGFPVP